MYPQLWYTHSDHICQWHTVPGQVSWADKPLAPQSGHGQAEGLAKVPAAEAQPREAVL